MRTTAYAVEILHIPVGRAEDARVRVGENELRAALADQRACALAADALAGFSGGNGIEILLDGKEATPRSPRDALKKGISVVSPESALGGNMTLLDHIRLLPGMPGGSGRALEKAEALRAEYGLKTDFLTPAHALSPGGRYRGEILLALLRHSRLLALREPEGVLTSLELQELTPGLRKACAGGTAVLLLTGMKSAAALADAVTVPTPERDDAPMERLDITPGGVTLEIRNFTGNGLRDVSFEARAGEILAMLGQPGSGKQAVMDALTGAVPPREGRLRLNGRDITGYSVRERVRAGIACVPGPDRDFGLPLGPLTMGESMALRRYREPAYQESGFLRRGEMRRYAGEVLNWLNILPGEEAEMENRLRCALTRETDGNIHALIALNPTAGMDEATARDVWSRLISARNERRAVVLLTPDIREALLTADRVLTLHRGEITGEFDPALTTEKELGLFMTGRRQEGEERFDEE